MKGMTVKEIERAIGARLIQGDGERVCRKVSTDTRTVEPGDLFFALAGEKFDAHDFISQAIEKGAAALVVSREWPGPLPTSPGQVHGRGYPPNLPVLLVKDTLEALQALAAYNRRQFDLPVIGVTGSNGKTTTKDMIAAVLGQRFKILKTEGNLNNQIGLPLTLLQLDETYGAAVVEMGMRGLGEIDLLARISRPTGAVITNIGETHLERLGSVENIARAKGEILDHVAPGGFALLNGDNPWVRKIARNFSGKRIFYGLEPGNDLRAVEIRPVGGQGTWFTCLAGSQTGEIFIPVPGCHNVSNALAAIGAGLKLGLSLAEISEGLGALRLTGMRLEIIETPALTIINDAYNANPASMKEALQVLRDLAGGKRAVAVLGSMFELGERTLAGHREVGEAAARAGVQILVGIGEWAGEMAAGAAQGGMPPGNIFLCRNNAEGIEILLNLLRKGDIILVKGSRGMKMEEIVKALIGEDFQQLQGGSS